MADHLGRCKDRGGSIGPGEARGAHGAGRGQGCPRGERGRGGVGSPLGTYHLASRKGRARSHPTYGGQPSPQHPLRSGRIRFRGSRAGELRSLLATTDRPLEFRARWVRGIRFPPPLPPAGARGVPRSSLHRPPPVWTYLNGFRTRGVHPLPAHRFAKQGPRARDGHGPDRVRNDRKLSLRTS